VCVCVCVCVCVYVQVINSYLLYTDAVKCHHSEVVMAFILAR